MQCYSVDLFKVEEYVDRFLLYLGILDNVSSYQLKVYTQLQPTKPVTATTA